jgi:hypothetical protein
MKNLSFALISSLILLFSGNTIATNSIGIEFDDILFFECGKDVPVKQERIYTNHFIPEARYINVEFYVKNLKFNTEDQEYKITFVWKYLNGTEMGRIDGTFNIKSEWETAYMNRSWGWPEKGNWRLGRYTAQILINGKLFAEEDFFINPNDFDFFTFSKENKPIENLLNRPEDIDYMVLQQYNIDTSFTSFYKIEFSEDGKDLLYKLSYFEQYETYNTETTVRNVYLFRNNKQILPVYFRIDAYPDNELKNLAFTGTKTTKGTFNEMHCYYNGRELFKSIYSPRFYLSPDHNKFAFIWNSMPILKSSFTWDAAYEYLLINNLKVQPASIADSKTINITQPVVYLKNQDKTYNVVYTARNKAEKDYNFALYNETERISPLFNGDIGTPHLSPDESKVAYIVEDNKKWFVMINDKKITKGYDKMNDKIIFCESENNVIYQAKINDDWYVMKGDEMISDGFSKIESITLSSDENTIAYKARSGKVWNVYMNKRKVSAGYKEIGDEIALSPDGNSVAYVAATEENMFVMINDKQVSANLEIARLSSAVWGKSPLGITNLVLNKTGDKVAYLVNYTYGEGDLITHNEEYYLMINDYQISPYMYSASVFSKKAGQLIFAGIDISDLILHHVMIEF